MAHMALRCGKCAFGSKADQCVKCGGPFGKELAYQCDRCSFGNKAKVRHLLESFRKGSEQTVLKVFSRSKEVLAMHPTDIVRRYLFE